MIAFIDNKDSFTFNIVQSLERVSGSKVCVFRSEEASIADIEEAKPSHIIVGPKIAYSGNLFGTSGNWSCFRGKNRGGKVHPPRNRRGNQD